MTDTPTLAKLCAEMRARAEAATRGEWTVDDFNADDLRRPNRFAGPVVIYADDDCTTHPVADCSCNHSCRDADEQRSNAEHIVASQPTHVVTILDAIDASDAREAEKDAEIARLTADLEAMRKERDEALAELETTLRKLDRKVS